MNAESFTELYALSLTSKSGRCVPCRFLCEESPSACPSPTCAGEESAATACR